MSDAVQRKRAWVRGMGIKADNLHGLVDRLEGDFAVEFFGLRQLDDIEDEFDRAVVSDQIVTAAEATVDNLVECKLHELALAEIAPPGAIPAPTEADSGAEIERDAKAALNLAGYFRAAGSSLDCMAACAIGVTRIPTSVTKASHHVLSDLAGQSGDRDGTQRQREAWGRLGSIVDDHRRMPPDGWYDWLFDMRNAQVHRPRQTRILIPETKDLGGKKIALLPGSNMSDLAMSTARFSLHLRRRPGLPDLHDLATADSGDQIWMSARATDTLPAVFMCVNALLEDVAKELLATWTEASENRDAFPAPVSKWKRNPHTPEPFNGISPIEETRSADELRGHPNTSKRWVIADRLKRKGAD